jgi:hypothetical protein
MVRSYECLLARHPKATRSSSMCARCCKTAHVIVALVVQLAVARIAANAVELALRFVADYKPQQGLGKRKRARQPLYGCPTRFLVTAA